MPLSEVVVIEIGHSVAAPYAGQILGDLGAEVIKVEKQAIRALSTTRSACGIKASSTP
jgi:crotonobetainyl-CoA:carnitine CoA-transferase CaiB-like acyl-CoA transferase